MDVTGPGEDSYRMDAGYVYFLYMSHISHMFFFLLIKMKTVRALMKISFHFNHPSTVFILLTLVSPPRGPD